MQNQSIKNRLRGPSGKVGDLKVLNKYFILPGLYF